MPELRTDFRLALQFRTLFWLFVDALVVPSYSLNFWYIGSTKTWIMFPTFESLFYVTTISTLGWLESFNRICFQIDFFHKSNYLAQIPCCVFLWFLLFGSWLLKAENSLKILGNNLLSCWFGPLTERNHYKYFAYSKQPQNR